VGNQSDNQRLAKENTSGVVVVTQDRREITTRGASGEAIARFARHKRPDPVIEIILPEPDIWQSVVIVDIA